MINTFKLLHDWSKWLITLETAICVSLWSKLTDPAKAPFLLYVGWMLFVASIVIATLLVLTIAFAARRSNESVAEDFRRVRVLVVIEYALFLSGVACFILRMFQVWAPLSKSG